MKNRLIVVFLLLPLFSFSQVTIQGTVEDSIKQPLIAAQVLVHDSTGKIFINYAVTDDNGNYRLEISKYQGPVILTAQSMGYAKKVMRFYIPGGEKLLTKNFTLQTKKTLLKEVVITASAYPMEVKKDTVTYNVNKFINGSEEVVEDVLKKLPGIEISEDGDISYKGRPIKKVLLEGDNLLGENYKVLTKNLGANTIKKVQAIDHYVENKNLKGIEKSDKTILNLQLKDSVKAKPYGNTRLSYGDKSFYDISINALGVNKNVKYYLLGTSNNIGINNAPNDYISLTTNSDEIQGPSFMTSVGYEFPDLKVIRVNFNHLYFGSSNLLINVNKKLKIRNNLYLTKDRNLFNEIDRLTYLVNVGNLTINEIRSLVREPLIGEGFLEVQYALTNHSDLDYKIKYRAAATQFKGSQNSNDSIFNESLQNRERYIHQKIDYTHRINNHNALLVSTQYFYNQKTQNYNLGPFPDSLPFNILSSSGMAAYLMQQSAIMEQQFEVGTKYIGNKKFSDYQFKVEYSYLHQSFSSNLFSVSERDSLLRVKDPFINMNGVTLQDVEAVLRNRNNWKKWKLLYELSVNYKTFSYRDTLVTSKLSNSLFLSPLLGIAFESEKTKFSLVYSSEGRYSSINDLYSGYILTDYRTLSKGTFNGDLIRTRAVLASFLYQDFGRQLMFYSLLTYIKQNKTFGSRILIDKYYTLLENRVVPGNKNLIFSAAFNKFLPFLYSTIKLKGQLSEFQYFNYVNQSERRNNKMTSGEYGMELNSGWKSVFNFYTGIKYKFYHVKLENASVVSKTKNLITHLDFIMNLGKKLRVIIQNEHFFYDIKTKNTKSYYFLDAKVRYTVTPNKFSIQLIGNNLLGKTTFDRMSISDYMISTTQYNLVPRQILLDVKFRF